MFKKIETKFRRSRINLLQKESERKYDSRIEEYNADQND